MLHHSRNGAFQFAGRLRFSCVELFNPNLHHTAPLHHQSARTLFHPYFLLNEASQSQNREASSVLSSLYKILLLVTKLIPIAIDLIFWAGAGWFVVKKHERHLISPRDPRHSCGGGMGLPFFGADRDGCPLPVTIPIALVEGGTIPMVDPFYGCLFGGNVK